MILGVHKAVRDRQGAVPGNSIIDTELFYLLAVAVIIIKVWGLKYLVV